MLNAPIFTLNSIYYIYESITKQMGGGGGGLEIENITANLFLGQFISSQIPIEVSV